MTAKPEVDNPISANSLEPSNTPNMSGDDGSDPIVVDAEPDDLDTVSVSSENEGVREKLKKTTIAPSSSRPESAAKNDDEREDEAMASPVTEVPDVDNEMASPETEALDVDKAMTSPETEVLDVDKPTPTEVADDGKQRSRKRSHDESDEDNAGSQDEGRRRQRTHERKRSREISEEDRVKIGSGLERVKTPPTHAEETTEAIADRVADHSKGAFERKRSLGKLDKEEDVVQKTKVSKITDKETLSEESGTGTAGTEGQTAAEKENPKLPEKSGFTNFSSKSPFAAAGAGGVNIFASASSSQNSFATSKFGALSGSSASPFGTLGAKSGSQSPFGALGAKVLPSGFGGSFASSGSSSPFGTPALKTSSAPKKPFGAPDDSDKSDDEDGASDAEGEEKKEKRLQDDDGTGKALGLKEQEVMTGEEDETTIFKCNAKVFTWDKEAKAWKERGRGHLKVNRKEPREDEYDDDDEQSRETQFKETEAKETEVEFEGTDSKGTESKETDCKEIGSKGTEDKETETKETEYKEIESKDKEKKSARIILRTEGTYVVVLNTPIHGNMRLGAEPSGNSFSFTAIDPSGALSLTTLRVRSNVIAKELYGHIVDLQGELFSE